jgi:hypothetical protein
MPVSLGQTIGYSSASAFGRGPTLGRAVARVGTRNLVGDIVGNRGSLHCRERRRDARILGGQRNHFLLKTAEFRGRAEISGGIVGTEGHFALAGGIPKNK